MQPVTVDQEPAPLGPAASLPGRAKPERKAFLEAAEQQNQSISPLADIQMKRNIGPISNFKKNGKTLNLALKKLLLNLPN